MHYGARILYYADADETFAEYELDYIIFAKKDVGIFTPNPNEVQTVEFVARHELSEFLRNRASHGQGVTPWFQLLVDRKLDTWWRKLEEQNEFPGEGSQIEKFL